MQYVHISEIVPPEKISTPKRKSKKCVICDLCIFILWPLSAQGNGDDGKDEEGETAVHN